MSSSPCEHKSSVARAGGPGHLSDESGTPIVGETSKVTQFFLAAKGYTVIRFTYSPAAAAVGAQTVLGGPCYSDSITTLTGFRAFLKDSLPAVNATVSGLGPAATRGAVETQYRSDNN